MKIFADRHHDGLAHSLRLLAKRLNAEIYFPIGEEWFTEGYWHIARPYNDNPATIKQYLSLDQRYKPADGTPPLNTIKATNPLYYEVEDLAHGDTVKAITFEQFLAMDIDIIIASVPDHWGAYTALRNEHKPKAKVVCQLGNIFWENEALIQIGAVENLLASVKPFPVPSSINAAFYHQEMPIVPYKPPRLERKISSFVNCLPDAETFFEYKNVLSNFEMKAYGASCPDGWVNGIQSQYKAMQASDWGYHVKPNGDGFGHVWYSWFMIGRPIITRFRDYRDKLGGELFVNKITGIDLDMHSQEENAQLIRDLTNPEVFPILCEKARRRFFEVVDYDREQKEIENFFGRLR